MLQNFAQAVLEGHRWQPRYRGVRALELTDAAYLSAAWQGRKVTLPLDASCLSGSWQPISNRRSSMAKLRFLVVGSGWRSLFYVRIAQALPQQFELCAVLCRSQEKADQIHRYGAPVSTSPEQCAAMRPDFVVVAVNKASLAQVSKEWIERGFAVLCETPAALETDQLRTLWKLHTSGTNCKLQSSTGSTGGGR